MVAKLQKWCIYLTASILWLVNGRSKPYRSIFNTLMKFHPEVQQYVDLFEQYYGAEDYISCQFIINSLRTRYGDILILSHLETQLSVVQFLSE